MNEIILDSFPFELNRDALLENLRIRPDSARVAEFDEFLNQAQAVARPKVIYKVAYIDEKVHDEYKGG